jgi:hypothetical protein
MVGRAGLEPATYGLKAPGDPEGTRELNPGRNQIGTRLAVRVLTLAARRDPMALAEAIRLAEHVLADGDGSAAAQPPPMLPSTAIGS